MKDSSPSNVSQLLSRDMLENHVVQRLAMSRDGANSTVLTPEELVASRRQYIDDGYSGPDIWVFGYGSLVWNPLIGFEEKRCGRVYGYHKRFCLWTKLGRGNHENPGLVLALDCGGSARGVAYRIAATHAVQELDILWRREMLSDAYLPKWLTVHTAEGNIKALGFVIRHASPAFAKKMPPETVADIIAKASGFFGPCSQYLFETSKALKQAGIEDLELERLVQMVKSRQAE